MHRIDGAGHVDNQFVNEDPATNRPPTEVTPDILNTFQEELAGFIEYMQIALAKGDNTQLRQALLKAFPLKDGATGLIRTLTPAGGARVRELGDIPNAATVGGIEYGFCYNCNIDLVTGVWAGRDVADICWLEKWTDVGGVKEFWYAPTAAAGVAPAWELAGKIDLVNGIPQFDNSKRFATMEAVRSGLGSLSGFTTINANIVLTAAHAGRGCYFSASAIASLPLANSVPAGTLIHFSSFTTGLTSVARQGTDTIAASSGSSALTSMGLLDGEDLTLESNGNNQWVAIGGTARLRYAGSFKSSMGASGYKFYPDASSPSGYYIEQWGVGTITSGSQSTATFPLAFPTVCLRAIPVVSNSGVNATVFMNLVSVSQSQAVFNANAGAGGPWNYGYYSFGY